MGDPHTCGRLGARGERTAVPLPGESRSATSRASEPLLRLVPADTVSVTLTCGPGTSTVRVPRRPCREGRAALNPGEVLRVLAAL